MVKLLLPLIVCGSLVGSLGSSGYGPALLRDQGEPAVRAVPSLSARDACGVFFEALRLRFRDCGSRPFRSPEDTGTHSLTDMFWFVLTCTLRALSKLLKVIDTKSRKEILGKAAEGLRLEQMLHNGILQEQSQQVELGDAQKRIISHEQNEQQFQAAFERAKRTSNQADAASVGLRSEVSRLKLKKDSQKSKKLLFR